MDHRTARISQHRLHGTDLTVVADVPCDVDAVIDAERRVIAGYAAAPDWPQGRITLFILDGLEPLVRQVRQAELASPPDTRALPGRAMVALYDAAAPGECYVFVNRPVLAREGLWDDPLALEAMLAHEHAHPLSENRTTRAARQLDIQVAFDSDSDAGPRLDGMSGELAGLADTLCRWAPREVFANETVIRSGFGDALLHLDRRTVASLEGATAQRDEVRRRLAGAVSNGTLSAAQQGGLLLLGDFKAHLGLALEVAPFHRAGQANAAAELEHSIETTLFPPLEREVAPTFRALGDHYRALSPELDAAALADWGGRVLEAVSAPLADRSLQVHYRFGGGDA